MEEFVADRILGKRISRSRISRAKWVIYNSFDTDHKRQVVSVHFVTLVWPRFESMEPIDKVNYNKKKNIKVNTEIHIKPEPRKNGELKVCFFPARKFTRKYFISFFVV